MADRFERKTEPMARPYIPLEQTTAWLVAKYAFAGVAILITLIACLGLSIFVQTVAGPPSVQTVGQFLAPRAHHNNNMEVVDNG